MSKAGNRCDVIQVHKSVLFIFFYVYLFLFLTFKLLLEVKIWLEAQSQPPSLHFNHQHLRVKAL